MNGWRPDPGETRNDARFDLPEFPGPTFSGTATDYAICALPRSGSTLLAFLLGASGLMGVPDEYLHPDHSRVLARHFGLFDGGDPPDVETYLACVRKRRTSANGVFGIKVQYH
jgi:LPS sulfotransferase NodH